MTTEAHAPLDKRAVRRAFDRAAATYDAAAVLQREVRRRMFERLDLVRIVPELVLDAGCGTGEALADLRQRYPRARQIALDLAPAMTARAVGRTSWMGRTLGRGAAGVCGDVEALPLRDAVAGLVWSSLAMQWCNTPERAFAEVKRVLEPGGLFVFSTFGPDTLRELRAAFAAADARPHVNRFIDMHDLGDMLVRAGYLDPVMEMECITLTYATVVDLMRDLKAIGAHNVAANRASGLTGRRALAAVQGAYEAFRTEGRLPATFEVVYGHAWKPVPRTGPGGRRVIDIKAGNER